MVLKNDKHNKVNVFCVSPCFALSNNIVMQIMVSNMEGKGQLSHLIHFHFLKFLPNLMRIAVMYNGANCYSFNPH